MFEKYYNKRKLTVMSPQDTNIFLFFQMEQLFIALFTYGTISILYPTLSCLFKSVFNVGKHHKE